MGTDTENRAARLRQAREHAGFENAAEAANAFNWPLVAYRSHENGIRGLKPTVAKKYARAYKVSFSWLMTGEGLMTGPGIDAEVMALPADLQGPTMTAIREMLKAVKLRGKI